MAINTRNILNYTHLLVNVKKIITTELGYTTMEQNIIHTKS